MTNNNLATFIFCASLCLDASIANAAVSASEAATLKTSLTPMGGERAGNADGSIPAWTGQMGVSNPPGYVSGEHRPIPFADEKPLEIITSSNMAKYAALLPAGQQKLLTKFSATYKIEVYPTHRTGIAPQWVYDNTFKNATEGSLLPNGEGVKDAFAGIPFPIPKSGLEAMWNELLRWKGVALITTAYQYFVTSSGGLEAASSGTLQFQFPYYEESLRTNYGGMYNFTEATINDPPVLSGQIVLISYYMGRADDLYLYLPGQRRMRRAPNLAYDTPNQFVAGVQNYDEQDGFLGRPDRYDFTLVGKQEMIVPYNTNKSFQDPMKDVIQAHHLNPSETRFEKHRVWVIDAVLKPGARNVDAKRRIYLDEDTWSPMETDIYDSSGDLWKSIFVLSYAAADMPGIFTDSSLAYDFHAGEYGIVNFPNPDTRNALFKFREPLPLSSLAADRIAAQAAR